MRRTEATLAAGILALAGLSVGCNSDKSAEPPTVTNTVTVTAPTSTEPADTVTITVPNKITAAKIGPGAPKRQIQFGHIKSLKRSEGDYVLRFDPAQYLTGVTASDAMLEDTGSSDVANDNYVVDEGHRLLTYIVPTDTPVTVLTRQGDPANFGATSISVEELSQLVAGETPIELFEPLDTGVWIRVHVDTVCSIDQQYVP